MNYIAHFWGKVVAGKKRGRLLGFPTANLRLHKLVPEGIYISQTKVGNHLYPSVTFIGEAKTYGENDYKAESYILDFDHSFYGKWISIYLIKKIRNNHQFSSEADLIDQIRSDVKYAKTYFASLKYHTSHIS